MPKFAANLSMLFTEVPFMERFALARAAGFIANAPISNIPGMTQTIRQYMQSIILLDDDELIQQRGYGRKQADGTTRFWITNYNVPDPRRFILTNTISF